MDRLYAPWRDSYVADVHDGKTSNASKEDCVFCKQLRANDDASYRILRRFEHHFIIMNAYPYNSGHLLVLPNEHQANLEDLSLESRAELMELVTHSTRIVKEVLKCNGVNIGLNLGKAAGAGIPAHLHMHVLPRWAGDTNFLPLIGNTKQIGRDLDQVYQELMPAFQALKI